MLNIFGQVLRQFLERESDRFQNPIGSTLAKETEFLYDVLLRPWNRDEIAPHLDAILRIHAVQDFSPAHAVRFVFLLRRAIRDEFKTELRGNGLADELPVFESRIDDLALEAFDVYMQCREQIYKLRIDEVKRQAQVLLERANRRA